MVDNGPEALAQRVMDNPKYQSIVKDLILRLCQEAIDKGLSGKPAVKYVRNKIHQVGGAYFRKKVDYAAARAELAKLPKDMESDQIKNFCLRIMKAHASTAERQSILTDFFNTCLAPIAPITSILDLACGMNPLAAPWMPLAKEAQYFAYDIYEDMLGMIDAFFRHVSLAASAIPFDLVGNLPSEQTQVAFLLKSIPCLEQMDKLIVMRLLEGLQSEHILVSFPVRSLGGKEKGMASFYREHFINLVSGNPWQVHEFNFETELAFLVSK